MNARLSLSLIGRKYRALPPLSFAGQISSPLLSPRALSGSVFSKSLAFAQQACSISGSPSPEAPPSSSGGRDKPPSSDPVSNHAMFKEQMDELYAERHALFGFTKEDQNAWGRSGGSSHSHSASFMEELESARSAQHMLEEDGSGKEGTVLQAVDNEYDKGGGEDPTTSKKNDQNTSVFTHLSPKGDGVAMVDVGTKAITRRSATAESRVVFPSEVMDALGSGGEVGGQELVGPKGPIFATAKLAGIMGAKRTGDLIPLCHPLPLDKVHVDIRLEGNTAIIECECRVTHRTGVEMEALTGASIAALTVYDMVKAVSHKVRIEGTVLVRKTGGRRDVGPKPQ